MRCVGCNRELEVGDRYIVDTTTGFINAGAAQFAGQAVERNPEVDDIIAELFGAEDGKVRFCEDCTEPGGDYFFETYYGDDPDAQA